MSQRIKHGSWSEAVCLAAFVVGIILAVNVAGALGQSAHGDTPGIETSSHGVVRSSTLPHCVNEDGRGSHVRVNGPCTWNIGSPDDGNGRGLAYVVFHQRHTVGLSYDYVWVNDPTARAGWVWDGADSDCALNVAADLERCPDGTRWRVSTGEFLGQTDH